MHACSNRVGRIDREREIPRLLPRNRDISPVSLQTGQRQPTPSPSAVAGRQLSPSAKIHRTAVAATRDLRYVHPASHFLSRFRAEEPVSRPEEVRFHPGFQWPERVVAPSVLQLIAAMPGGVHAPGPWSSIGLTAAFARIGSDPLHRRLPRLSGVRCPFGAPSHDCGKPGRAALASFAIADFGDRRRDATPPSGGAAAARRRVARSPTGVAQPPCARLAPHDGGRWFEFRRARAWWTPSVCSLVARQPSRALRPGPTARPWRSSCAGSSSPT